MKALSIIFHILNFYFQYFFHKSVSEVVTAEAPAASACSTSFSVRINPPAKNYIEVLPGVVPELIKEVKEITGIPIFAGGFIRTEKDVEQALAAGASAVTTSDTDLWKKYWKNAGYFFDFLDQFRHHSGKHFYIVGSVLFHQFNTLLHGACVY